MVNNSNKKYSDDDVDDFIASLLSNDSSQSYPKRHSAPKATKHPARHHTHARPKPAPAPRATDKLQELPASKPSSRGRLVWAMLIIFVVTGVIAGSFLIAKDPISRLLQPPTPFGKVLQSSTPKVALYYPTKLPGSFKIDIDTIKQPDSDVVVYAITDEDGKRINITLQKRPEDLDLEPLYTALTNIRELDTTFGTVRVGATPENAEMVNILAGDTWIVINFKRGTITDEQLVSIISSLKED